MKIGIDARLINQTGVGRYIKNLIGHLSEIDKKNEYVLFIRGSESEEFKNSKFKTIKTNIRWHSLEEQIKLPRILEKENLDLVHFPYFSVPVFYNRPFVVTIHDLILHHFSTGQASTLPMPIYWSKVLAYKYAISKATKKARKIITVSNSTKNEIIDHLSINPNKITVTHEAVDENIMVKPKKPKNIKLSKFFLFVGNVYPHKNAEALVSAFEKLDRKEIGLVFVGKEDYFYKRLKEKTKRNTNIEFMDYVLDEELGWLYKNSIAAICPAFMEGFGLPALEAMANDCLVIASDIPAFREACGKNVIYFNPEDSNELSSKMLEVLENKDKYINLIKNGFNNSREFSWTQMVRQTLQVYEDSFSS